MANEIFWLAVSIAATGMICLAVLFLRLRHADASSKPGTKIPLP